MFDPLRAKGQLIVTVAVGFLGGLTVASGMGWTGPSYAMPAITMAPQVTDEAVRPAMDLSDAFANTAASVTPAVVRIEVIGTRTMSGPSGQIPEEFRRFFDIPDDQESGETRETPTFGGGSGFLISEDGYILTNDHVVGEADDIRVYLTDKRNFTASIVGSDPTTDVAVIKIEADGLPYLSLGDSEALRVGEWVLAIGNPGFGGGAIDDLDYTVTAGIVSAKGRPLNLIRNELNQDPEFGPDRSGFAIEDYIQTDAVINRGNSGGPMVNLRGQVVGINSAIMSPNGYYTGYGFAIPVDLAGRVMEDLIEFGRVRRAWLGVQIQEITLEDAEVYKLPEVAGVHVMVVTEGGPAEGAGLRQGDVLYSIDGTVVHSSNGLQNLVAQKKPGDRVSVEIYRDGRPRELTIRLAEAQLAVAEEPRPEPEAPAAEEKLGIGVLELTEGLAQRYGYETPGGVIISQVTPLGPAARKGIGFGAKIMSINGQTVATQEDVRGALNRVSSGDVVSLRLGFPDGTTTIVNVRAGG